MSVRHWPGNTVPSPAASPRFQVLGIGVDRLTTDQAASRVIDLAHTGGLHHVVTINPEFVMTARRDAGFRMVLSRADLATADGIGIVWAARLLGDHLPERVGGVELLERIAAQAEVAGLRLFLLGGAEGVAAAAGNALLARYPRLVVAGSYAGSPRPEDAAAIVDRIHRARPHILFVAFGSPAQDLWIDTYQGQIGVPVAMGVGGAFDYLAGRARRAPTAVQRAGFEWLYRLIRQPWRWRRMLALPRFGVMVLSIRILSPIVCRR